MEIRYLDVTALVVAIISVLMVGCVIDSGKDRIIVEEQEDQTPSGPVPIQAPTTVVAEEPKPVARASGEPTTDVTTLPAQKESVTTLLAKKPTEEEAWLDGVVIDILSSRPGYSVGNIRESRTFRRYPFTTDQRLQRWQEVRFRVNRYDEVLEITVQDADGDGEPDIVVREHGGTSLKRWEDGLRVMEGTTERIRHARDGKTYGFVRVHDGGFRQYAFASDDYFSNYERVEIKLDQDDTIIEISRL